MFTVVFLLLLGVMFVPPIYCAKRASKLAEGESRSWRKRAGFLLRAAVLVDALLIAAWFVAPLWVEYLWYENLSQPEVFSKGLVAKAVLFVLGSAATWCSLSAVLWFVYKALPKLENFECQVNGYYRGAYLSEDGSFIETLNSALRLLGISHPLISCLAEANEAHRRSFRRSDTQADVTINPVREQLLKVRTTFSPLKALLAVGVGVFCAQYWQEAILALNSTSVGTKDPIFQADLSWYLFQLPLLNGLSGVFLFVSVLGFAATLIASLVLEKSVAMNTGAEKHTEQFLTYRRRALALAGIFPVLAWSMQAYLAPYNLLLTSYGRVHGIGATADNIMRPTYGFLLGCLAVELAVLLYIAFKPTIGRVTLAAGPFALACLTWVFGILLLPLIHLNGWVRPSEFEYEKPYLEHEISFTREAYGLENVEVLEYDPHETSFEALKQATPTLDNIRLWDNRALSKVLDQIQEIRAYYDFPDVDVNRMHVNGRVRQVMLASREINLEKLPEKSQSWNNKHLVYTHGYGVVLNCSNEFKADGSPRLHIQNIPPVSDIPEITITRPEIYFGELTNSHAFVKTSMQEFDYPHGDDNVYTVYSGKGGVPLGSGLRRLAFAITFDGVRVLLSDYLKADSEVLWARNVQERVSKIAPFLKLDRDHYKVIRADGSLWYVVDGFTTSGSYPYSEPFRDESFNYIRNSVKVAVDAYNGTVELYLWDETDPIIAAWKRVFPKLFKAKGEMPEDLRTQLRYPEDLLHIQAAIYGHFHMKDPQKFYMAEDTWSIATELYENSPQLVEPYSALIELPGHKEAEYVLMLPFTPQKKNNLVAWMAGRSDEPNLGKLIVYRMPNQRAIWGPMQIEAKIDQNPEMSAALSLWKQKGSDVIRGNVLVIPIEGGLLYVEPIYLRADQSPMPELTRVVVAYGDQIAWDTTFDKALAKVFGDAPAVFAPLSSEGGASNDDLQTAHEQLENYLKLMGNGQVEEAGKQLRELRELLNRASTAPKTDAKK